MSAYAICFDFPESDDPWFAAIVKDGAAFTQSLGVALRFDSEAAAERMLENAYGPGARKCGTVVEVGS